MQYVRSYKHFLKYKNLVAKNGELKDIHKGKRCFILGSGPSIKKEDLKPLKNEIVFALNNFYVHEDFAHIINGDMPKYYMTAPVHPPQTEDEWKRWFEDMETHVPEETNMIFGLNTYNGNIKYLLEKYGFFKKHNIIWYFTGVNVSEYYNFNPKDIDITQMIWNAGTVSIYALIVAIYMGFDKIYLLGMDHNYVCKPEAEWRFYKDAIHQKDEEKRTMQGKSYRQHNLKAQSIIFEQYQILKDNSLCKIYNTSETSLLDIFEFKNLKEAINE